MGLSGVKALLAVKFAQLAAGDKADAAWEAAKDEPETLDKTEAVIGEVDTVYTAAIGKAEAKLRAALKESEATFKAAIVEAETLTARRDIAATFQAPWPKALVTITIRSSQRRTRSAS